jgi:O-antigen/teichoic acid export membrane protein
LAGYVAGQILRIGSNLVLTRLLVPEVFGVMAVATMVHTIVWMMSDLGLRQAVVQSQRGDVQTFLDTAWTLQAIRGCLIWLVCVGVAAGLHQGSYYGWFPTGSAYVAPQLPEIIAAVSFTAVIAGFQSTKVISSDRHLDLKRVTSIEFLSQVINLLVAVLLAWLTRSIWSFVVAALVSSLVSTVLSHVCLPGPINRIRFEREAVRDLVRFGRWIMLSSIFTVIAANGDRALLAAWVSPATLGFYILAANLVAMLDGAGGRLFSAVATPAMSKVVREHPETLRRVYYKLRLPFDLLFIGGAGALYSGGQALIDILYDRRYAEAGFIIQVLSFGLLFTRFTVANSVYLAMGHSQNLGILNLSKVVAIFTLVPLSYHGFGFEGALWAIAIHGLATVPLTFTFTARYRINSLAFECLVLLAWPLGYLLGEAAATLGEYIRAHL